MMFSHGTLDPFVFLGLAKNLIKIKEYQGYSRFSLSNEEKTAPLSFLFIKWRGNISITII